MRADLSTIQQTLTPEAANVLNQSIAEAARRNHGQTTPLHVAATLLASPSGFLRQACIKSHPNSSHPLQCRALELCFSVALERLPTAAAPPSQQEPPVSNALMAALKRSQAHQRRGCPEQQQQPLLAVKVELEQLIISILDDPSVSRVMREASFSSPAVKAAIEQSLTSNSSSPGSTAPVKPSAIGFGFRTVPGPINRNLYLNPRIQQSGGAQTGRQRTDEAKRVMDILARTRKRNPVLVGESEPQILVREILGKIENGEFSEGPLGNLKVIRLLKDLGLESAQMATRVKEITELVESRIGNSDLGGVIIDLGDLKWLVEHQQQEASGRGVVAEVRKLLERYGGRLCLIGTATCETYLRCQVYYPSLENDWDLQAIPIAAKSPRPGIFCGLGGNNAMFLNSQIEPLSPARSLQIPTAVPVPVPMPVPPRSNESLESGGRMNCCPLCMQNYRNDLASYLESEPGNGRGSQLPQWLQNAKACRKDSKINDEKLTKDQGVAELRKKWNEACLRLHPGFHRHHPPNLIGSETVVPARFSLAKLWTSRNPSENTLQLNSCSAGSPPGSPVGTDLVLGRPNRAVSTPEKTKEERVNGVLGHGLDIIKGEKLGKGDPFDIDVFKKLLKGLAETVWWQHDAASAVAAIVTQCKLGNGKTRGVSSKGDIWLLFTGPDRIGKRKMASALSDVVSGSNPITINPGLRRDDGNSDLSHRGKTELDRITEAVKRNPFKVIVIEDIDEADTLLRSNIKRAMACGRICDSYGREVSLGNAIFILNTNWSPENNDNLSLNFVPIDQMKLNSSISNGWQLRLSVCHKSTKRRPSWLYSDDQERRTRQRKEIAFDLNELAEVGDDRANESSPNSSDVTVDHDHDDNSGLINNLFSPPNTNSSIHRELVSLVDATIFFRPVDFGPIKRKTADSLEKWFSSVLGNGSTLEIKDDTLEKIAGGIMLGQITLEDWIEQTMVPSLNQIKSRVPSNLHNEQSFLRLELDEDSSDRTTNGSCLPSSIRLVVE